jgi:tetratricopeptide (TPR) repeat protein
MRRTAFAYALAIGLIGVAQSAFAQSHDSHIQPEPPDSLSAWAHGAQLFEGLGNFHRKITTRSPLAQRYFDQGMRFIWAFNHDEATRSFAKAAQIDPTCASCYWGVALTLGPNYNMPLMNSERARVGWEAVRKGEANARRAKPVERALIAAVAKRYIRTAALDPSNSAPLLKAYVDAMRDAAAKYPADLDVQTLYAEALMNTNPWKLWNADGTPGPGTPQIVAALRHVLNRDPRHPGANHYYIHAIEASPHPEQALPSAITLMGMMPAAGHLDHMPAHILQRVGRYEAAAEANRKGAAADLAYLKRTAPPDYYPMYLIHNYQFLASSAAMEGRRAEAIQALKTARENMPDAMLLAMPGFDWSAGYLYDALVRFGMWDEMLSQAQPNPQLVGETISYLQGRASALAAKGRYADANAELAKAETLIAAVPPDATQGNNAARPLYDIGQLKARAGIAGAQGHHDDAVQLLTQAVELEDKLAYNEPSDMFFPVRHLLGEELLEASKVNDAEAVFREDLKRHPNNGWALYGLSQALAGQKRDAEAAVAQKQFGEAWRNADVHPVSSGSQVSWR